MNETEARLNSHEAVCAFRYEAINARLKRLERILIGTAGFVIVTLLAMTQAKAQDTNMNMKYSGQPVPSAISPSMSAFSQDNCLIGVSGAVSSTVIGFSGGSYMTDTNCVSLKWAKFYNDAGLKVTAVSIACQAHPDNWYAMEMAGTPCPIGGAVGDSARQAWYKLYPERFEKLYGKDFKLPAIVVTDTESK